MKLNRTITETATLPALLLVGAAALLLHGCSEYDISRLQPNPSLGGDSAQVFLFSDPLSTAQILAVEEKLVEVDQVTTPRTVVLPAGDYVIHFSRPGYRDVLEGVLLGPGSYKEVSVRLDSLPEPGNGTPPTASISVTPSEITIGESVEVTVQSDGDVGVLLPIGIFTTAGTYTDVPGRVGTYIYSFAAFRGGHWATAADSVFVRPAPPPDPEQGQILVFSNPRSDVEIYDIAGDGELISTGEILRTPFVVNRDPGPVAFTFREPGYQETTRGVLLGAGQVKEVNVDLVPVGKPVAPPTVELTVEPRSVKLGAPVTYKIRTTNADYSIFFGQEVQASSETEWTWTTVPDRTRISSALAFGPGGVASDTTLVIVNGGDGGNDCTTVDFFPAYGPTRTRQRITLTSEPITIPEHVGPVTLRIRCGYSGDEPGQEDEVFAAGLAQGNSIVWAVQPGSTCEVVPDPAYTERTTVWVDVGEMNVPPGVYDIVTWHISTGEFPCYEPIGDLSGPNSVHMDAGELTYCR